MLIVHPNNTSLRGRQTSTENHCRLKKMLAKPDGPTYLHEPMPWGRFLEKKSTTIKGQDPPPEEPARQRPMLQESPILNRPQPTLLQVPVIRTPSGCQ
jgi:hypothetical protein